MGSTRVSVEMEREHGGDSEKVWTEHNTKTDDKGNVTDSIVDLMAKGAAEVIQALDKARKRQAESPISESDALDLSSIPSARRNQQRCPIMPSVRNFRSKRQVGMWGENDGQTSPEKCLSRDQIRIQSPNWEGDKKESNLGGADSSSAVNKVADIIGIHRPSHNGLPNLGRFFPKLLSDVPKSSKEVEKDTVLTKTADVQRRSNKAKTRAITTSNMNHQDTMSYQVATASSPSQKSYMNSPVMRQPSPLLTRNSYGSNNSYSRPRSRAIAIKRSRRCAEEIAASQTEESNEKMYDWATWRMYNRIVDHRRNQQNLGLPGPLPVSTNHLKRSSSSSTTEGTDSTLTQLSDRRLDGEIFELEI